MNALLRCLLGGRAFLTAGWLGLSGLWLGLAVNVPSQWKSISRRGKANWPPARVVFCVVRAVQEVGWRQRRGCTQCWFLALGRFQ